MRKDSGMLKYLWNDIRQLPRKIALAGRYQCGRYSIIERGALIRVSQGGEISLGANVYVRRGTELHADGGRIVCGGGNFLNRNISIVSHQLISIGNGTTIGPNTVIYDHDHDPANKGQFISREIIIGRNAWIGANCTILKGVHIGDNAVIGAGSIVTGDVPADAVYYCKCTPVIRLRAAAEKN